MCDFLATKQVVTFQLQVEYMLGLYEYLAFTRLEHECLDLSSSSHGMHESTDCVLVMLSFGGVGGSCPYNHLGIKILTHQQGWSSLPKADRISVALGY